MELDAASFARRVSDHLEVKKVLVGPAEAALMLNSPHAGDQHVPGAARYDFAGGLQPLYGGWPVRIVQGTNGNTTGVGPNRDARIHAVPVANASLGLFCVLFPDAGEDFYVPPPVFDGWAGNASAASLARTSVGHRAPCAGRRPALVRFWSRDGIRLSVRGVHDERRGVIEAPVGEVPGLMLQTQTFLDLIADGDEGVPVLTLVLRGFDVMAAAELARGLNREPRHRGYHRAAHTLISTEPPPEGGLKPYSIVTMGCAA